MSKKTPPESTDEKDTGMAGFQALSAREMNDIFDILISKKAFISLKFVDSGIFRAKTMQRGWGVSLEMERPPGLGLSRQKDVATAQFSWSDEVYFFSTNILIEGSTLILRPIGDVFRLARRQSRRWMVPPEMEMHFTTKRADDRLLFLTLQVRDLSLHGARLFMPRREALASGSHLLGSLRVGARTPIEMGAEIRHIRLSKSGELTVGVQWLDVGDKPGLTKLIFELQTAAFQRKSKRE